MATATLRHHWETIAMIRAPTSLSAALRSATTVRVIFARVFLVIVVMGDF